MTSQHDALVHLAQTSTWLMPALRAARALNLQSWCIGAGAVRNLVWDHLHGYAEPSPLVDVDLAYFDAAAAPGEDARIQERLRTSAPAIPWEVTNQAHVHTWYAQRFGHPVAPLRSLEEAVATWPEYATSVGLRLLEQDHIAVIAPHGLADLFAMRIRRNPRRVDVATYRARIAQKQYQARWPQVSVVPP